MTKGLQIAEPPRRRADNVVESSPEQTQKKRLRDTEEPGVMFTQVSEVEKVQFNKRIKRGVADGYEMLAIRTRRKVPDLLEEALRLLESKYGKI